jgi:ATP-dependent RNA helicase RhlE
MSFDRLGLSPELLRAVAHEGYTEPTPVQAQAIPFVLAGRDVLAGAQTGTGKTAAFVLPMLQRLHATRPAGGPRVIRALILTPTRELALQVEESVRTYGAQNPIRSTTIYGGVGFDPQVRALRAGPEIVVATPGRLLDHVGQRTIDLSRVEILVLDEADRMLDMGFIRDIRKILAILPPRRQNLLFSATFSDEIRRLAGDLLDDPAQVQVTPRNSTTELVTQVVHMVDRERKRELLSHLITTGRIDQALVFTRTKHGANRLAQQLEKDGIRATAIHGNKSQPQRVRALADFKAGRFTVLVATEVAARGLDIEALPHVVNFELPMVPEDYVHRIGRTGRAGVDGDAVSLVCVDELKLLADIERVLGRAIPRETIPGFEPDPRIRPEPILRGGLGGSRPPSRAMSGIGAPRHGGQPRPAGQPRAAGQPRPAGHPRPVGAPRTATPTGGAAPRPSSAPVSRPSGGGRRPGGSHPGNRGAGFAGPRRPGQGIGNGQGGRPTSQGGHPGQRSAQGPHRSSAPGTVMPGERIARHGDRPRG